MPSMESSPLRPKSERRKCDSSAILTASFLLLLSVILLLQETGVFPGTRRGFYCDDDSLKYPYQGSTVPTWLLIVVFWGVPNVSFAAAELLIRKEVRVFYYSAVAFNFVVFACLVVTNLVKLTVGRLRPHFLYACGPDVLINATCKELGPSEYVTNYTCTNPHHLPANKITDVRLSFPSGHASMSVASGAFLLVYAWRRLESRPPHAARLALFFLTTAAASFVSVTRVMDYKHFPSDVAAGVGIGALFAFFGGVTWWRSMNELDAERLSRDDDSSTTPLSPESPDESEGALGSGRRFAQDSPLKDIAGDESIP